jgi:FAD/FMN-containing dehydrogenase
VIGEGLEGMEKTYTRKDVLKMAILAHAALYAKPLLGVSPNLAQPPVASEGVAYYRKGDARYEALRKGFNKRIDKFPQVIAYCTSIQGVSEAVQYAGATKLPVAIKSGGHCMEGFSCNDGGIVINLSGLNKAELMHGETLVTGPGATLANLYEVLLPQGRIIPGGSCAGVGIGGLTLGGGYGVLGREHGDAGD